MMRNVSRVLTVFGAAAAISVPLLAAPETYVFDKAHTLIGFRVRHVLTKVEGRFKDFDGTIWLDRANPASSRVDLTVRAASIDTANDTRDNDLRSPNYFDVEKYPTITFKSSKIEPKGNDTYAVTGDLAMHGVTKTIEVSVKHLGFQKMGKTDKAGFEIALPLNRKDYGIDKGGPVVGDDVEINIQVEANKKEAEASKPGGR